MMAPGIAPDMDSAQPCRVAPGAMARGSEVAALICQARADPCELHRSGIE